MGISFLEFQVGMTSTVILKAVGRLGVTDSELGWVGKFKIAAAAVARQYTYKQTAICFLEFE
jgi:hypothetical protein